MAYCDTHVVNELTRNYLSCTYLRWPHEDMLLFQFAKLIEVDSSIEVLPIQEKVYLF